MTHFWFNEAGEILLATSAPDPDPPIAGAVGSTETPPESGRQIWNFQTESWGPVPASPPAQLSAEELYDMLEAKNVLSATDRPRPKV